MVLHTHACWKLHQPAVASSIMDAKNGCSIVISYELLGSLSFCQLIAAWVHMYMQESQSATRPPEQLVDQMQARQARAGSIQHAPSWLEGCRRAPVGPWLLLLHLSRDGYLQPWRGEGRLQPCLQHAGQLRQGLTPGIFKL